jgi:phosphoserine aminotransferase
MLTLRWLNRIGGVEAVERINNEKAALLYDTIDSLPIFKGTVVKEDRSRMNACFVMENPELEKAFQAACKENGMIGVKGHRSVGGFRISLYNAMTLDGVRALTQLMTDFANKHA